MVATKVYRLQPYLPQTSSSVSSSPSRICELGCGCGGAGMSLLLFHRTEKQQDGKYHVVFTDNDTESLDLCKSNCELNGIHPNLYSQRLLWWGRRQRQQQQQQQNVVQTTFEEHSFHLVVATDVVYDLKMIRPMLQTAFDLLHEEGYFILSHVPRFCLPNITVVEEDTTKDDYNTQPQQPETTQQDDTKNVAPYIKLEEHIVDEATMTGFLLVDTIRPHEELEEDSPSFTYAVNSEDDIKKIDDEDNNSNFSKTTLTAKDMEEAHAVVFVFRRRSSI